jgi:hypothetical protein
MLKAAVGENAGGRFRHCEERSEEAIQCLFAALWIASLRSQ